MALGLRSGIGAGPGLTNIYLNTSLSAARGLRFQGPGSLLRHLAWIELVHLDRVVASLLGFADLLGGALVDDPRLHRPLHERALRLALERAGAHGGFQALERRRRHHRLVDRRLEPPEAGVARRRHIDAPRQPHPLLARAEDRPGPG